MIELDVWQMKRNFITDNYGRQPEFLILDRKTWLQLIRELQEKKSSSYDWSLHRFMDLDIAIIEQNVVKKFMKIK